MLGSADDEQLHHKCHLMTLGVWVPLLISWYGYVQYYYEMHAYVTQ